MKLFKLKVKCGHQTSAFFVIAQTMAQAVTRCSSGTQQVTLAEEVATAEGSAANLIDVRGEN